MAGRPEISWVCCWIANHLPKVNQGRTWEGVSEGRMGQGRVKLEGGGIGQGGCESQVASLPLSLLGLLTGESPLETAAIICAIPDHIDLRSLLPLWGRRW